MNNCENVNQDDIDNNTNELNLKKEDREDKNISISLINPEIIEHNLENLFDKVFTDLGHYIFNYLCINELISLYTINNSMKSLLDKYFISRFNTEFNSIKNYEEENIEKKNELQKIFDMNIPLSFDNWFYYDINKSIDNIINLKRNIISQIKSIKKLTTLDEKIYAPLCLIFNYNSKNEYVINNGWKKTADIIFSDFKFFIKVANLKIENFEYKNMIEAFNILNETEKFIDKIKKFSFNLFELNKWCKAVVIYYFLIHPYKYKCIAKDINNKSEIYKFANIIDKKIDEFYRFKLFLQNKKLINSKLGEFIFNFDFKKNAYNNHKKSDNEVLKQIKNEKIIGNILSYLDLKESIIYTTFNKKFYKSFIKNLDISCYYILCKIFKFKYDTFNDLYSLIPTIFENNIFSPYFFMLEDVLNSGNKEISFLTKDNINYIKSYKGNNELINIVCKIFCDLFNIKVERKYDKEYFIINLYIKSVILLSIKGSLPKLIRYFNIFKLSSIQIKSFYEELSRIYTIEKIKKVKQINEGFYQLLLWELYIFEYLKQFNPFLMINKTILLNSSEFNESQINIINDYIKFLQKLKIILKIKYHLSNIFLNRKTKNSYEFTSIIIKVIKDFEDKQIYNDKIKYITENYNINQSNIAKTYFYCNEYIPYKDKPKFFQKIMKEIIIINEQMVKGSKIEKNENNNPNIYIKHFLSKNNMRNLLKEFKNKNKIYNKLFLSERKNKKKYSAFQYPNNRYNQYKNETKISLFRNTFRNDKNSVNNKMAHSQNYSPLKFNIFNTNNYAYSPIRKEKDNNLNILDIPNEIFITKILFFLSIDEFPNFSLVNKLFYKFIKTHIYIRLFFLEKKKSLIERKYKRIISSIKEKRNIFFNKNNISFPSLNNACILLSHLTKKDIFELRILFKNYKIEYDIIISILCIFLNIEPEIYINEQGKKIIKFFNPGKKLLYNEKVFEAIQKVNIDSINYKIFEKVETILQFDIFNLNDIKNNYPTCLINLIKFEFGVMEYFRATRKYWINYYDYYMLNENEIYFCKKFDKALNLYYKIKNYTFNKCQKYHQKAINILKKINLEEPNLVKEIKEFNFEENNTKKINGLNYEINDMHIINNENNNENIDNSYKEDLEFI